MDGLIDWLINYCIVWWTLVIDKMSFWSFSHILRLLKGAKYFQEKNYSQRVNWNRPQPVPTDWRSSTNRPTDWLNEWQTIYGKITKSKDDCSLMTQDGKTLYNASFVVYLTLLNYCLWKLCSFQSSLWIISRFFQYFNNSAFASMSLPDVRLARESFCHFPTCVSLIKPLFVFLQGRQFPAQSNLQEPGYLWKQIMFSVI